MEHYFTNNHNLRSEIRCIDYENKGIVFTFFSDLGVFSKDKIDYGSRLLVETLLRQNETFKTILDVGCGYGFLGIVLGKFFSSQVEFIDVNKRAVHLCEKNIEKNKIQGKCYVSDGYENVNGTFDLIVTNPPVRAGKEVVLKILRGAHEHLTKTGELWFVMRKEKKKKSILKAIDDLYINEVIEKDKGFYIIRSKSVDK